MRLTHLGRAVLLGAFVLAGGACRSGSDAAPRVEPATLPATQPATQPVTLANPWRYNSALERFDADDAAAMPAAGGIVFTGASSVRRWAVTDAYPDLPVLNRGFGGSHSSDCVFFYDRVVLKYRPRVVVLFVGSNDLDSGRPPEVIVDNLCRFAELLRATLPDAKLLMVAVKPSPSRPKNVTATLAMNVTLRQRAARYGYSFVDPTPGFLDPAGNPRPELYVADRLHYSPAGYAVLNAAVGPELRRLWAEGAGAPR